MASATFDGFGVRVGQAAGRRRTRLRGLTGATGSSCARRRPGPARRTPTDHATFLRGIGVSVLIASGYVAFVSGLRWLLCTGL